MTRDQSTRINLSLRAAGAMLLVIAYLCWSGLRRDVRAGPIDGNPVDFLLAAVTFLSASGGSLLLTLGAHILDPVEVARRWQRVEAVRDESDRC